MRFNTQTIGKLMLFPTALALAGLWYGQFSGWTSYSWLVIMAITLSLVTAILSIYQIRLNKHLATRIKGLQERDFKLKKLGNAVTNSGSSILITDELGRIEYVNTKFTATTGLQLQDVYGSTLDKLNPPGNGSSEHRWDCQILRDGWEGELISKSQDGDPIWSAVTISTVAGDRGVITNYVISCIDITELKEANQKMEQMALFDPLTGLANRRLFIDRLEQAVRAAKRDKKNVALLFLDLDQFKRINDTLGHDAGDSLLKTVASRLQRCVRQKDTVSRLGGDEFTILLTDIDDHRSVTPVAQHVLQALKEPVKLQKHEVIVSTSIGITLAPIDGQDADALMKNADLALYRAKEHGRDCYHYFTEELNEKAQRQLLIEQELRQAIENDEFSLSYQPQVDLKTERIVAVEALLRWHHPQRELVRPGEFISVAEETGQVVPIGAWVLKNACLQMKMLQQLTGYQLRVAINLSARQFEDPHLEKVILDALQETGLEPRYLELEVTESMLMGDIDSVVERLSRLKACGITITIDDFGSGYSSLSYLKKLPVDILKVDQEFVRDIPDDLNDMEITSAIVAVAHKLNLKVIAEGVENIDQRDFLVINKCDFAQGYYFSRPLSFERLYQHLSTHGKTANILEFPNSASAG